MKNIHVLPTEKPSRLIKSQDNEFVYLNTNAPNWFENNLKTTKQNIYITSDEEIKEGDWYYYFGHIIKYEKDEHTLTPNCKKIILSTDPDLIKDGVQAIDDEFLWWFSENPSCERAEVVKGKMQLNDDGQEYGFPDMSLYKIIIPQEEPKQETLEEAAEKLYLSHENNELLYGHSEDLQLAYKAGILDGAKWQQERMYSEEELEVAFFEGRENTLSFNEWFEQFKKK